MRLRAWTGPTSSRTRRARAGVLLVAALALATSLAACGDDPADSSAGPVSSSSPSASTDPTSAPGSTESGVEPATGKQIVLDHVSLTAPEGWTLERSSGVSITANAPTEKYYAYVTVYDQPVGPGTQSLHSLAKDQIYAQAEIKDPAILPNTEVAGERVYHIGGPVSGSLFVDGYGPSVDGALVDLYFAFIATVPKAQRERIIDSVLATVEWTT